MLKFLKDIFKDKRGGPLPCVEEIKRLDRLSIMRLKGDIDFDTVRCASDNIREEMKASFDRNILLDFRRVTNVDSSTLAYLISLLGQLQKQHRKLGVINTDDRMDNYLVIERVSSLIHKYNSEEEAVKDMI